MSILLSHRQFSREHFAGSLSGKRANEHSQRFIAMIARRASSCSASSPTIAFLSRPDHNACLPTHGASLDLNR
jgi:hypothetical protein